MPSRRSRRRVLRNVGSVLVSVVGLAGCLGDESTGSDESTETTHSETMDLQTTTEFQTGTPQTEDAGPTVEARALAAEERYLESRLQNASCLLSWGTTATTASEEATIVSRSDDGIVVDVTHPYWYSKEGEEADIVSEAFYLVNETGVERTSGDDVSPC
ncbi:hypothetical protein [Haloferax sp. YSSS75]|uniref:hypothetical protein n=1 Tax=Haloferax sp. YSSS75 TaxID=3388564 RepID=UPI00398D636B